MTATRHSEPTAAQAVLAFWFGSDASDVESVRRRVKTWFSSDETTDREIAARFGELARSAATGVLDHWSDSSRGRLALILLLDQFSRNLHRGSAAAFDNDDKALRLTLAGMRTGQDRELTLVERGFFYMPMQHAESIKVQQDAVAAFEALEREAGSGPLREIAKGFADSARLHRDIVREFGRFPHRNSILGRPPTATEEAYLARGGPSFGQGGVDASG